MSVASPSDAKRPDRGVVLVTGASGFTGIHLLPALAAAGYAAAGLGPAPGPRVQFVADLTRPESVREALARAAPRYVIHLAGISFVAHGDADTIYRVNTVGSTNLLEACAGLARPPEKVILASSANVYGIPATMEPLHEGLCPAPVNHYGASKLAMECVARAWFDTLPILITRPFNYTGVGQDPQFVVPKIVQCFRERAATLDLGDTSAVRDFSDARDVAEMYVRLLGSGAAGETVNLCSGTGSAIRDVIDTLTGLSGHRPEIRLARSLLRAAEIPWLVGSPAKLERLIGDLPRRPLAQTLEWMLRSA